MRPTLACILSSFALCLLCADHAVAQQRLRIAVNVGSQATTTPLTQAQTFQQYFEQGSFTFDRTTPTDLVYDASVLVRLWRSLHAGMAVSIFDNEGAGTIEARVPHPLQFNRARTTSGEIADARRLEIGQHVTVGWSIPAVESLDFMVFGGPSFFTTEQTFVTGLMMTLDKEVFPFTELAFPGAQTEVLRENVIGYNVGVDMTWRFSDHIGVGALFRYASGRKDFSPTGSSPVEVEVGGLHAGGGLRVGF